MLQEESTLLEQLSRPVQIERDVWAGSLSRGGMLDPIWQPAEVHAGTAASMLRNVGAAVCLPPPIAAPGMEVSSHQRRDHRGNPRQIGKSARGFFAFMLGHGSL